MRLPKPITLAAAPWAPDMPALQNQATMTANGVLPLTAMSYGPVLSPLPAATALNAMCQGAAAFLDANGDANIFAGDAHNLYLIAGGTPTVISKSSGAYNTPIDGQWKFAQFGNRILANNFVDPIQSYVQGVSSAFADLSSAAPKARYAAVIKSFYMVANTEDPTGGEAPQRVWWAANNDPTNWPTPGTAAAAEYQSSYVDIVGPGGWNQAIVGNLGTSDGALFQEHAVWRIIYQGPPTNFGFYPAEGVKGTPAPNSVVQFSNQVYYLGEDGFYRFDGTESFPIGADRIDKTFFADVNTQALYRVWAAIDPINKVILWAYPSTQSASGLPDKALLYNWQLDRWSEIGPLGGALLETIFWALSPGYTLEGLDAVGNLDTLKFSLDSRVWTGGTPLLAGFDQLHRMNFFNGPPLPATVDTIELQPSPGVRSTIFGVRPLVDGATPSVAIGVRNRLEDPVVFGNPVAIDATGKCPQRANGRYVRARITIPAGASWTHIEGLSIEELTPGGVR